MTETIEETCKLCMIARKLEDKGNYDSIYFHCYLGSCKCGCYELVGSSTLLAEDTWHFENVKRINKELQGE